MFRLIVNELDLLRRAIFLEIFVRSYNFTSLLGKSVIFYVIKLEIACVGLVTLFLSHFVAN